MGKAIHLRVMKFRVFQQEEEFVGYVLLHLDRFIVPDEREQSGLHKNIYQGLLWRTSALHIPHRPELVRMEVHPPLLS
jgi:hypothetical protein